MKSSVPRTIVVALFAERNRVSDRLAHEELLVNRLEFLADRAVVVFMEPDGELSITGSAHSAARSVATLAAKLMIALPLGFHGAVATAGAGRELEAAERERGAALDATAEDLATLAGRMRPGWSAVVAAYEQQQLEQALQAYRRLGAAEIWSAPEELLVAAASAQGVDDAPPGPSEA